MLENYVPIIIAAALVGGLLIVFFSYAAYQAGRVGK
jgi:hypothetical protein